MKKILAGLAVTAALAIGAIMPHTAPAAGTDGRTWASSVPIMPHTGPATAIMPHVAPAPIMPHI